MDRNTNHLLLALTFALSGFGAGCSSSDGTSVTEQAGSPAVGGSPGLGGGASAAGSAGVGALGGTPATAGEAGTLGGSGGAAASDGGIAGFAGLGGASAGAAGQAGSTTGGAGASGGAASGVPAGYPEPTAANWQKCKTVAQVSDRSGMLCPGGGLGPVCYECLFGGSDYNTSTTASADGIAEAGNYAVTVALGGTAAGSTQINAETNRILLSSTATAAGQSATYSFVVNVRQNEGQPVEPVAAGYPGLDLFFSGTSANPPQVTGIGYALVSAATKPVMVYIASDSTACDQTDTNYAGWGQALPSHFAPPVGIANYADSGEGSGSFLNGANKWGAVKALIGSGDWVIIQFGHNDGSTSSSVFQASMTQMVKDAKAKGALPLLVSPPARATFSGATLSDQSSLHSADTKAVATAQSVPYIDLTTITTDWYNTTVGASGWEAYHAVGAGGGSDKTHTNIKGAIAIAGFVATAIKSQNIGLAKYLR